LFNDADFNRQQLELLTNSLESVRKPLEKPAQEIKKGVTESHNSLKLLGGGERI
jgi:exonuclease VII small subunit